MASIDLKDSWYVLHVRPRAELAVARQLAEKGYEQFVPLYRSRRRWADRVKDLDLPLFPSYVFCRVTSQSAGRIVTTPGVVRIVGAGNVPVPVDEDEVRALQRVSTRREGLEPWPYVHVGQRVELRAGPLRGLQGVLVQASGGDRLIVSVSLLQRSVSVRIDACDVAPVGPAPRPEPGAPPAWAPAGAVA